MTDPRAVAKELLDALPVIFTCSQYGSVQLCKKAEEECIDTIMHALADAERRGMERAAGIAQTHWGKNGSRLAEFIRAQAQADKEGDT